MVPKAIAASKCMEHSLFMPDRPDCQVFMITMNGQNHVSACTVKPDQKYKLIFFNT